MGVFAKEAWAKVAIEMNRLNVPDSWLSRAKKTFKVQAGDKQTIFIFKNNRSRKALTGYITVARWALTEARERHERRERRRRSAEASRGEEEFHDAFSEDDGADDNEPLVASAAAPPEPADDEENHEDPASKYYELRDTLQRLVGSAIDQALQESFGLA